MFDLTATASGKLVAFAARIRIRGATMAKMNLGSARLSTIETRRLGGGLCARPLFLTIIALFVTQGAPPARGEQFPSEVVRRSWSGFYVGANAGYGWANAHNYMTTRNTAGVPTNSPAGNYYSSFSTDNLKGVFGGAQIGFNLQSGNFVGGGGVRLSIVWPQCDASLCAVCGSLVLTGQHELVRHY